jgi:hypothetical protein
MAEIVPSIARAQQSARLKDLSPDELILLMGNLGSMLVVAHKHELSLAQTNKELISDTCARIGAFTELAPRDTLYSYVTLNDRDPVSKLHKTFTGDRNESNFIALTRQSLGHLRAACRALAKLDLRDLLEASRLLEGIDENLRSYHKLLGMFKQRDPASQDGKETYVSPEFFYHQMRDYFPPLKIGTRIYEPPSAAYSPEIMELDLLLGTVPTGANQQSKRMGQIEARLDYLTPEDRKSVVAAIERFENSDSVLDRLTQQVATAKSADPGKTLLNHVVTLYLGVLNTYGKASFAHWALVKGYLIAPNQAESREQKGLHAVDPELGVSGMTFDEVKDIRDHRDPRLLRTTDPRVSALHQFLATIATETKKQDQ